MSFLDELNEANQSRKNAQAQEISGTSAKILEAVKKRMLEAVRTGGGDMKTVRTEVLLQVSPLSSCHSAENDISAVCGEVESMLRLVGRFALHEMRESVRTGSSGTQTVWELQTPEIMEAVIAQVTEEAIGAGLSAEVTRKACQGAVICFTARLDGAGDN